MQSVRLPVQRYCQARRIREASFQFCTLANRDHEEFAETKNEVEHPWVRAIGRFLSSLNIPVGFDVEDPGISIKFFQSELLQDYFKMPIMNSKHKWATDILAAFPEYLDWLKDVCRNKENMGDEKAEWSSYHSTLDSFVYAVNHNFANKMAEQRHRRHQTKCREDRAAIDKMPTVDMIHEGARWAYSCIKAIHGSYSSKDNMPL